MDSEPIASPKENAPSQEMLKSIFDTIGILSWDGEEAIAGRIRNKNYTHPITIDRNNLTNVFLLSLPKKANENHLKCKIEMLF